MLYISKTDKREYISEKFYLLTQIENINDSSNQKLLCTLTIDVIKHIHYYILINAVSRLYFFCFKKYKTRRNVIFWLKWYY